ncbi:TlpA family protein disulfide reductase [Fluviispira sanaruensis]|nr:hypothetical protein [Fluviispira sanaruensis]
MFKYFLRIAFFIIFLNYTLFCYAKCKEMELPDFEKSLKKLEKVKLVFFSTWCLDCKEKLEKIKEFKSNKDNVILINTFTTKSNPDDVLKAFDLSDFTCVIDSSHKIRKRFSVDKVPKILDYSSTID